MYQEQITANKRKTINSNWIYSCICRCIMEKGKDLTEKFRKFIESLSRNDIIAVLHHTDPDGICSGVIIARLIEKVRGKRIDLRINQAAGDIPINRSTVEILKANKVNKLVVTDLCIDQETSNLKEVEKFSEILVIDHHKVYNDISSKRVVFIKPDFVSEKKSSAYPASKFCFDLVSEFWDISSLDWVAAVGLIGDCAFSSWKSFIEGVLAKYSIEKSHDIFQTSLGKCASLISDAESFDISKVEEAFNIVYSSSSPEELLSSPLQKCRDAVENEISYWKSHISEFAEFYDGLGLIFYFIRPKYRIKAPLNTQLSFKYPESTIIILQESEDGMIGISARRRDEKLAVNELLENAVRGLKGASGGGHVPAAGAKIRKQDLQKFKENLIGILKSGK